MPSQRTEWYAPDLGIVDEPLVLSLLKYRQKKNRWKTPLNDPYEHPNLVSSITDDGKQMPILDLDFAHVAVESNTPGHTHLYLNEPISKLRWIILMWGLYVGKQIELGFFVWSLRRGGNFVRIPGIEKRPEDSTKASYGWFFKLKDTDHG